MVKYADGPSTASEIHVDAAPEVVWELVTDINLPGSFSDEFERAEWLDDGPAIGARFRGFNNSKNIGQWDVVCTVTDCEPNKAFEWTVGELENKVASWRFDLGSTDAGTSLRFSAIMGPGPSGLTPMIEAKPENEEKIVAFRLEMWRKNMVRTLEGIRDLAEAA